MVGHDIERAALARRSVNDGCAVRAGAALAPGRPHVLVAAPGLRARRAFIGLLAVLAVKHVAAVDAGMTVGRVGRAYSFPLRCIEGESFFRR